MKSIYIFFSLLIIGLMITPILYAQDERAEDKTGWNLSTDINLTLTQNSYSNNWAGDENSSVSWTGTSSMTAEKQLSEKVNWDNSLKLAFGQTHLQRTETERLNSDGSKKERWKAPQKSTDEIDLNTIFRFTLGGFVDPYVSGRLETQFINEEKDLFDPQDYTEAAGIARQFFKRDEAELMMRLGFALRHHIRKDEDTTQDSGIEYVMNYQRVMWEKRLKYVSQLRVYKAFLYSESDKEGVGDEWKAPDVDWENTFNLNIVKYISINLYTQLLYDKEVDKAGRFKETLGLGFTYNLL